jgi:hypothetical protein
MRGMAQVLHQEPRLSRGRLLAAGANAEIICTSVTEEVLGTRRGGCTRSVWRIDCDQLSSKHGVLVPIWDTLRSTFGTIRRLHIMEHKAESCTIVEPGLRKLRFLDHVRFLVISASID